MQIPENGALNGPHYLKHSRSKAAGNRQASIPAGAAAGKPASVETTGHLKSLAAASSEVRESLVQDIRLKLQTGEYLTKQAAYEAADAILNL